MSASFPEPSAHQLRAEAEATRSRLIGTVGELRTQVADTATDLKERLSPTAIKNDVTEYVRESKDQFWNSIEKKARDNPLQAVAIGAALAYPALQMVRALPAPLLLVGAGLLLSRTGASNGASSQVATSLRTHAQGAMEAAGERMENASDTARRGLNDARDYLQQGVDAVKETATAATASMKDRATSVAAGASTAVSETADKITGGAEDLTRQARAAVTGTFDQNPLLVAGIGLAIGAFIAAAFPATEAEENLFGETSDALRRQAEGIASKGVDAAKAAVESAAGAASEQGLSVDGLSSLGASLTEKARKVAERGVEAALGDSKPVAN